MHLLKANFIRYSAGFGSQGFFMVYSEKYKIYIHIKLSVPHYNPSLTDELIQNILDRHIK